jgi:hypothetical protein
MTFTPVSNDPFEHYFYQRAQLADEMADSHCLPEAYTLATASLEALAQIWFHDFPDVKRKLEKELGGTVSGSIRLTRLLKNFCSHDPRVEKVAVICFAEDWKHYRPQDAHIADQLLNKRLSDNPIKELRSYELPKSYLDVSRNKLAQECPYLANHPELFKLMEEYEYGALIYTFYRCPLVHSATESGRTHGFSRGEEVMYLEGKDRIAIGFGLNLVTRWLRNVVSSYIQSCQKEKIVAADNLNAGNSQEKRLERLWKKLP